MPALARKTVLVQDDHRSPARAATKSAATKTAPRRRWHEDKPDAGGSTQGAPEVRPDLRHPDSHEVRELLSHFGHGDATREATSRVEIETKREARRRARRRHRPFRMTMVAGVLGAAPLCLLACLLWLHSSALALSRSDAKLQDQISAARFDLERTRKEIAALNASPNIDQWAKERGWQRATQKDFDQVPGDAKTNGTSPSAADDGSSSDGRSSADGANN